MKTMTKITALLIALVMSIGCFAACDQLGNNQTPDTNDPSGDGNQTPGGDDPTPENPIDSCIIDTVITFESDDEKMKEAIEGMNSSVKTELLDGNIRVTSEASLEDTEIGKTYTLINGLLYSRSTVESKKYSFETLRMADASAENKTALLDQMGAASSVDLSDFTGHKIDKKDGGFVYNCTNINDRARESLVNIYGARFESTGATVQITDVALVMETTGDKTDSKILTISFLIDMDGDSYEVTMVQTSNYTYGDAVEISEPENADAYDVVSIKEILN